MLKRHSLNVCASIAVAPITDEFLEVEVAGIKQSFNLRGDDRPDELGQQ